MEVWDIEVPKARTGRELMAELEVCFGRQLTDYELGILNDVTREIDLAAFTADKISRSGIMFGLVAGLKLAVKETLTADPIDAEVHLPVNPDGFAGNVVQLDMFSVRTAA